MPEHTALMSLILDDLDNNLTTGRVVLLKEITGLKVRVERLEEELKTVHTEIAKLRTEIAMRG